MITLFGRYKGKDLKEEFDACNKKEFLVSAFCWCLMLISSVKAYELGNIALVTPLFALTSIINAVLEFLFSHNKNKLFQKLVAAILIIIGVILVKL